MSAYSAAATTAATPARGRVRAAWTLALMTTLCAELTFTAVAVPVTWILLPLLMLMYGAGVLLIRELTVRVGGGWPSLVALGVAYELAEDGLGLQALNSPDMYGAADWGMRALGINWTYWDSQIGIHVVLSVLLPVMILNMLFPQFRGKPYLRTPGLVVAGVLAVLGVFGLRFVIAGTENPDYQLAWGWTVAYVALIAVFAWVGLRVLPRRFGPDPAPSTKSAPRPVIVGIVSGYLTMAFLTTLLPLGLGPVLLFGDAMAPGFRLFAGAATAIMAGWLIVIWRRTANWNDSHRIWLAGGILVSHTAFMIPASLLSVFLGLITIGLEVAALIMLSRHLRRRDGVVAAPR
ncbi:hypothetical protein FB381_2579 [Nocardioides albertanoniae]|uniref:Uncharacterized protein n=1 Tax=Nocardioides albertanoniae TaxID=1175486 RepID=A0A543A7V1_9ACTN|nr:hypothetical protein [Nocardioides albertanoniae]TQL68683.1 hypothetical protein FB381_2579 [Nocardioides albertanoniae]